MLHGRGPRAGFGWGFVFGLGFLLPLLVWTGSFRRVAARGWRCACSRPCSSAWPAPGSRWCRRLPAAPLLAAAVWVAGEALRGRVPFGGLPWGRVGFGQPDGPLLPLAAIGGEPLLSFATVLAGLALGELVRRLARPPRFAPAARRAAPARLPALLLVLALVAGPLAALVPPAAGGAPPSAR